MVENKFAFVRLESELNKCDFCDAPAVAYTSAGNVCYSHSFHEKLIPIAEDMEYKLAGIKHQIVTAIRMKKLLGDYD